MLSSTSCGKGLANARIFEEGNEDLISRHHREGFRIVHGGSNRVGETGLLAGSKFGAQGGPIATPLPKSGGQQIGESRLPIKRLTLAEVQEK